MQRSEFEERTESFLTDEEMDRYEEDFEPAYMECEELDKDEFCSILKDKTVRNLVMAFSQYVLCARAREKDAARCFKDMLGQRDAEKERADRMEKCIALVQSTCDRAMAGKERNKT